MWTIAIGALTCLAWFWLLFFRGRFWQTHLQLTAQPLSKKHQTFNWPSVCAIVPARNEADMIPQTLGALLNQSYQGHFSVILVDDQSHDETVQEAKKTAVLSKHPERLTIVSAPPLPEGWAGKVWAMQTGLLHVPVDTDFLWFTDADIFHPPHSLERLVDKACRESFDLVSIMVRLHFTGFWGSLMIPAFVYFFAKLYPFRWVSRDHHPKAAAAGGSILVRHSFIGTEDGLAPIAGALIDDCSLARLVQSRRGKLWLGLGNEVTSLRAYPGLGAVWKMVTRSAFVQLRYSLWLLLGTVLGMLLLYVCPVVLACTSLFRIVEKLILPATENFLHIPGTQLLLSAALNVSAWVLMSISFIPILRWYRVQTWRAALLPLCGFFYTCMTIDSARRFWQQHADAWKGRPFQPMPNKPTRHP
ncbi:glycosyltransferase [Alicyclobacillus tolerans]|uniref:Hopene-associated glycosyltransferase HpnB n=1 Tax=Alicyclobacillus tolerans TaxID=90970 RepID=A0A1M6NN54_9BACL|nr:glycosyltransferase [Alicyclobacillus montanus]SHJ97026.1 hopene-associated glycosyltransferase HpnB [Alicyclobacillus montanus]